MVGSAHRQREIPKAYFCLLNNRLVSNYTGEEIRCELEEMAEGYARPETQPTCARLDMPQFILRTSSHIASALLLGIFKCHCLPKWRSEFAGAVAGRLGIPKKSPGRVCNTQTLEFFLRQCARSLLQGLVRIFRLARISRRPLKNLQEPSDFKRLCLVSIQM